MIKFYGRSYYWHNLAFFIYFSFVTMHMNVECLLRSQCSHSSTKSLWFPLCCINFLDIHGIFPIVVKDSNDLPSPVVICLCTKYCSIPDPCIVDKRIRGEFPADSRPISLVVLHILCSFALWFSLLFSYS